MKSIKTYLITVLIVQAAIGLCPQVVHAESTVNNPTPTAYDLAYPGLLPDHPLYFLKVARDNLMEFFKSKPLDKATFDLLQSDKNLAASDVLVTQKQRPDLAFITLDEAHESLSDAITQTLVAKKEGVDIHEICQKLKDESGVQIKVLDSLKEPLLAKDPSKYNAEKSKIAEISQSAYAIKP